MIRVTMISGEKNEFVSCKAIGHSGFAKQGFDIVCSAVSVLYELQSCPWNKELKLMKI